MISRALPVALAGVLIASLAPASADAPPVVARTGELTSRPGGLPTTSEPARQLKSAVVEQGLKSGRLTGTVVLNGLPGAATAADLHVSFGNLSGTNCAADFDAVTPTAGSLGEGFTRSGSTFSLDIQPSGAAYEDWDCAFAALTEAGVPPAAATTYDVLIGPLKDVYGKPSLQITEVELLRSKVKTLKLVRNVWTKVNVTVKNVGDAPGPEIRVSGAGKGLQVKAAKLGEIHEQNTGSGEVSVRLTATRKRTLKLVARGGGATASRRITVAPVAPPRRPVEGEYRSKDGSVSFRIADGRVIGWRGYMQTRCGGFPDLFTYTMNTYDFPKTKVPRNGIVNARDRGKLYGVGLMMKVAGSRVTRGYFFYSGPARCFASEHFTARRR